ncbi:MAG: hypothetical protein J2P16_03985 [Mycobacterium sp.]|nr:hypothetical protein [Mycobacterium sp.]
MKCWLSAVLALAAASLAACASSGPSQPQPTSKQSVLEVVGDAFNAQAQGFTKPDQPWVAGLISFCVNSDYTGDIRIVRVWATKPDGLRLVAWGLRHVHPGTSFTHTPPSAQATLARLGHFDHGPVTARCGKGQFDTFDSLGVQVVRLPGHPVATTGALAVEYIDQNGKHVKQALPGKTALCVRLCPRYVTHNT